MNNSEVDLFRKLTEHRSKIAYTLELPAVSGVKQTVVEKYSDQAHFIYELIQNADDAGATFASFTLEEDRLLFLHNGTRHFSVTDPDNEYEDTASHVLGDINSITSIANSNKEEASIGKFGVGFKAVFQYTETPHIYDSDFKFKIERFVVPVLLDENFPEKEKEETLFVFPFNHPVRSKEEAYRDIKQKLRNLSSPLLFLSHLESIEFDIWEKDSKENI